MGKPSENSWRDCDDCYLFTTREAERQQVVLTDAFPDVRLCPRHDGSHDIVSWVETYRKGWFQCSCGEQFKTKGFGSESEDMSALHAAHQAAVSDQTSTIIIHGPRVRTPKAFFCDEPDCESIYWVPAAAESDPWPAAVADGWSRSTSGRATCPDHGRPASQVGAT